MARQISFRTGEFAKIVGVNKRTLHYYDEKGIFCPDHVAENGYRSYSFQQFYPFVLLRQFRAMGLDLAEIQDYMQHRSPARLDRLLADQQEWLKGEMARLKRQMQIVANQRELLAIAKDVTCDTVEEQELPAERLILSKNVRALAQKGDGPAIERLITEFARYVAERKASAGYGIGAMVAPEDYLSSGCEHIESYYFTLTGEPVRAVDKEYRHLRPAGRYLVTYFQGSYDETARPYALLRRYLEEHQLHASGYAYEESVLDETSCRDARDYLTRIIVPIG